MSRGPAVALLASLALMLCGASPDPAAADHGGVLRILDWQAPTIVNPHLSIGNKDLNASRVVYEPLASYDKDGNLVPFLAERAPSRENGDVAPDGKSVVWNLKKDVKWADGEPFTAADVQFTFEYASNPEVGATSRATYAGVERVEAIDDHTIKVVFKEPTLDWAVPFVGPTGQIIPKHVFEAYSGSNSHEAEANRLAVGTGPYKVREFLEEDMLIIGDDVVSTVRIIYELNPYFREAGKPHFDTVEFRGGGDAKKAAEAVFRDGSIDVAINAQVPIEELNAFEALGKATFVIPPSAWTERVMINFADPNRETEEGERASIEFPHPILTDLKVRQALSLGIDRKAIEKLYGRTGPVTTNLVVSPTIYASPNTTWEFNLDKASNLLTEAGWIDRDGDGIREKDGRALSLEFLTSVNPVRQKTQEIIKETLESIGFEIRLKIVDASVFFGPVENSTNTRRHFYADLEMFAYSNKTPDPQAYLSAWLCREAAQMANNWSGANWARYCNPEFDALWEQAAKESDAQKRRSLIIALNDMLINDVALIPLVERPLVLGVAAGITGMNQTPWDQDVWDIKDWKRE